MKKFLKFFYMDFLDFCGKCNRLQSIQNEIALLTANLPLGYNRDLHFKGYHLPGHDRDDSMP